MVVMGRPDQKSFLAASAFNPSRPVASDALPFASDLDSAWRARKAERREVFDRMRPGIARSCPDAREVKDAEVEQKVLDAYVTHLPEVLRAYGKGLKHGGKYAPRSLPRLLTLWLA